jgi:hypothetical protein
LYSLAVTDTDGCVTTGMINITISPVPLVDLGPDTAICTGYIPVLSSRVSYAGSTPAYLWSTGSIASSITAPTIGTYWLQVTIAGCSGADTMRVLNLADTLDFYQHDTAICKGDYITVTAIGTPGMTYQWRPTTGISHQRRPGRSSYPIPLQHIH